MIYRRAVLMRIALPSALCAVAIYLFSFISRASFAPFSKDDVPDLLDFTEWERSKASESEFWDKVLQNAGQSWERFDRNKVLPSVFRAYFRLPDTPNALTKKRIYFLVVGSGPSSDIGYKGWSDVMLNLFLTDPLAPLYEDLFNKHQIFPPALIHDVAGETMSATFSDAAFDMVYSVNAIDHATDPMLVLQQMQVVLKPCAVAVVEMWENEAHMAGGIGMHQWNFFYKDKAIFLQKFGTNLVRNVRANLLKSGAGEVICQRFSGCFLNGDCNYPEKPRLRLTARKDSGKSCAPIAYPNVVEI